MRHMYSFMWTHSHTYSWKLGPDLVNSWPLISGAAGLGSSFFVVAESAAASLSAPAPDSSAPPPLPDDAPPTDGAPSGVNVIRLLHLRHWRSGQINKSVCSSIEFLASSNAVERMIEYQQAVRINRPGYLSGESATKKKASIIRLKPGGEVLLGAASDHCSNSLGVSSWTEKNWQYNILSKTF